jgi:putative endonuclease
MHIVYVIEHSETHQIYIGYTNDLKRRIDEHNSRSNRSTIRKEGKWIVIYAEAYRSKKDAYEREQRLKAHGSAKHSLFKRLNNSRLNQK